MLKCPECMAESFDLGMFEIGDIFNEEPIVVRNVAGAKCSQCGFLLLPASVAKEISKVLALGNSVGSVRARLYDLAEADFAKMLDAMPADSRTAGLIGASPAPISTPMVDRDEADNLSVR